jgi:hypothetical protein
MGPGGGPGTFAGEVVQVGLFIIGQTQRTRDRGDHLPRRPPSSALLQTDVVVHRHGGQLCDLLPAQARGAAPLTGLEPAIGRPDPGTASPQKRGQLRPVECSHASRVPRRCRRHHGTADTSFTSALPVVPHGRQREGMTTSPDNRIVLITGADKGIGLAAARELTQAGHTVLLGPTGVFLSENGGTYPW